MPQVIFYLLVRPQLRTLDNVYSCSYESKNFITFEEAFEYRFSEQIEAAILSLAPQVDELTDEDNINNDELGLSQIVDIAGITELEVSSISLSAVSVAAATSKLYCL